MSAPNKGDPAMDLITGVVATVQAKISKPIDGHWKVFYLLDPVPLSPNYPSGWRLGHEIRPIKAADME